MADASKDLLTNPGEVGGWPGLRITYATDPEAIAKLLPPGIEPAEKPTVHLRFYQMPVLGAPEFGCIVAVAARYRGETGRYAIAYTIDQEEVVQISYETTGQPKYYGRVEYYRMGDKVRAGATHQGYRFVEFEGRVTGPTPLPESLDDDYEYWVKWMRTVDRTEKAFDFPPHVVTVTTSGREAVHREHVEGELTLRESPWDPIANLLPIRGDVSAELSMDTAKSRVIELAGALDPVECWPYVDTIGTTRWPGLIGGPKRKID